MSPVSRCVLAGLFAILAGGCGAATNHSNPSGNEQATAVADYGQAAEASCTTGEAEGKPLTASCVFVLANGRRFTCPERFAQRGSNGELARALHGVPGDCALAPERSRPASDRDDRIGAGMLDLAQGAGDRQRGPAATGHPEQPRR